MIPVVRRPGAAPVADLGAAVRRALADLSLGDRVLPGMKVGIPVGSRGIRGLVTIVRELVNHVRALGAEPVVVSAMGSHGGGTAVGQRDILVSLGVTEAAIGVPIHAETEAAQIGQTAEGLPIFFDRRLLQCDAILVANRVKPHTSFRGRIESGLIKMLVVGCGKPEGARLFHSRGSHELGRLLEQFGGVILSTVPVVGGLAILENEAEETAAVLPVHVQGMIEVEAGLLVRARAMLPRLPVTDLDLLIVDQMGKNFSGTGLDTNVIGRSGIPGASAYEPRIKRIAVLDLSAESHGNANGVGLADCVSRRLVDKIDYAATYLNVLTTMAVDRAKIPMMFPSDREVIEMALRTAGSPAAPRVIRIANTLDLTHFWVSETLIDEVRSDANLEPVGPAAALAFDAAGNLF